MVVLWVLLHAKEHGVLFCVDVWDGPMVALEEDVGWGDVLLDQQGQLGLGVERRGGVDDEAGQVLVGLVRVVEGGLVHALMRRWVDDRLLARG